MKACISLPFLAGLMLHSIAAYSESSFGYSGKVGTRLLLSDEAYAYNYTFAQRINGTWNARNSSSNVSSLLYLIGI